MRLSALITVAASLAAAAADARGGDAAAIPDPDIQQLLQEISADRIQRSIYVLSSFKTRHTTSDPLPSGDGIGGAGAWVRAEFERASADSGGRLKVDLDSFDQPPVQPALPNGASITNIVATLPGTDPGDPERTLVVSGHYDSIPSSVLDSGSAAPGADDDASGVAAVLEIARQMAHHRFRATIVFLVVAGEEQGLFGSAHWAQGAKERGANIEAMLENDIIGSSRSETGAVDRGTVRLFAQGIPPSATLDPDLVRLIRIGGENDTPPRELARAVREAAASYVPSMKVRVIYRTDRYLRGSDHIPFLERGYPAVRLTEPAEDFHRQHQDVRVENGVEYGDVPAHVDFAYTADVARVTAAALATIARAPAPPSEVQIEAARLENDTTLRWAADPDPTASHRVVWRETTSPFWEHSLDVAKGVNRVTLPGVTKDNFVFGVESVDPAGHASPAVFPAVRRTL
jgi:hypothetical protein